MVRKTIYPTRVIRRGDKKLIPPGFIFSITFFPSLPDCEIFVKGNCRGRKLYRCFYEKHKVRIDLFHNSININEQ